VQTGIIVSGFKKPANSFEQIYTGSTPDSYKQKRTTFLEMLFFYRKNIIE